jgi:ABC-type phosphate transport system substrate-binding protein
MRRTGRSIWAIAVALSAGVAAPAATRAEGYTVVVNAEHRGDAVTRKVLADVFLKRATRWGTGEAILVVDQSLKSEVRVAFTHEVLELSSLGVMTHWQQQLIHGGERPPAVKRSDDEVLEYVASHPGAIGYVTAETPIQEGVKSLRVIE